MTWNIQRSKGAGGKFRLAHDLGLDIIILQECPEPERLAADGAPLAGYDLFFDGTSPTKGLLVATKRRLEARRHGPVDDSIVLAQAIQVRAPRPIALLAVHSYNHRAPKVRDGASRTPLPDALAIHADWLSQGDAVVAGDFNSSPGFREHASKKRFGRVLAKLTELGLTSIYHHQSGEPFGEESFATHVHSPTGSRHHIDYVFVGERLLPVARYETGPHEAWASEGLSDHAPVLASFNVA